MDLAIPKQGNKFVSIQRVWFIAMVGLSIAWLMSDIVLRLPMDYEGRAVLFAAIIVPICFVLLHLFVVRRGLASWHDFGLTTRNAGRNAAYGVALGAVALVVAVATLRWVYGVTDMNPPADWQLYAVASGVAAPIWEELLFRGMLFGSLLMLVERRVRTDLQPAVLLGVAFLINIFFLTAHWGANLLVIYLTGFAYVFAFYATRSLVTPIIAHAVYNLTLIAAASWF